MKCLSTQILTKHVDYLHISQPVLLTRRTGHVKLHVSGQSIFQKPAAIGGAVSAWCFEAHREDHESARLKAQIKSRILSLHVGL